MDGYRRQLSAVFKDRDGGVQTWLACTFASLSLNLPHGGTPVFYISNSHDVNGTYPYTEGWESEHWQYSAATIVLTGTLLFCHNCMRCDHPTARVVASVLTAVVSILFVLLLVVGLYLAHNTRHGQETSSAIGLWLTVPLVHTCLATRWPRT